VTGNISERMKNSGFNFIMKKLCFIFFIIVFIFPPLYSEASRQKTKRVKDRIGRSVNVPVDPQRIACFFGPSYEKVFLLGSADKVAVMSINQPPWPQKLNPALKKITVMPSYSDPDVEKIISMGIDLVFYWHFDQQINKISAAGIPVVCPASNKRLPKTLKQFIESYKDDMRFYGEVLGEKAKKIAHNYCAYYDERMKKIFNVTSRIPTSKRPKVYYVSGRNVFGTQGRYSLGHWLVEMAGGTFASREMDTYFAEASMEQIISWDPEVIILGGFIPTDAVSTDPRWQLVRAVKEKKIYKCPEGVFLWGHGSSEVFLFVMWLAKILHPDQFLDINLEEEVKNYYSKFYNYKLSDDDVKRILNRIPPEGFEKFLIRSP